MAGFDADDDKKALALELLLDAWDLALKQGVTGEQLASTAMFAALSDMVDLFGEEAVAQFCEALPQRVRAGEFTLSDEPDATSS